MESIANERSLVNQLTNAQLLTSMPLYEKEFINEQQIQEAKQQVQNEVNKMKQEGYQLSQEILDKLKQYEAKEIVSQESSIQPLPEFSKDPKVQYMNEEIKQENLDNILEYGNVC